MYYLLFFPCLASILSWFLGGSHFLVSFVAVTTMPITNDNKRPEQDELEYALKFYLCMSHETPEKIHQRKNLFEYLEEAMDEELLPYCLSLFELVFILLTIKGALMNISWIEYWWGYMKNKNMNMLLI